MLILRLPEVKRILGHRADASVYNAIRAGLPFGRKVTKWVKHEPDSDGAR